MADVLRSCTKTGCRWPAAASLSYRYATRQVWLLDLAGTPDPSLYDLCPHHADDLRVPRGWDCVDERTVQPVMIEPSASDRAEEAARRRWAQAEPGMTAEPVAAHGPVARRDRELVSAGAGRSRYAALVEQLPQLAATHGVPEHADDDAPPPPPDVREWGHGRPEPRTVHGEPGSGDVPVPPRPLADLAYRRPTTGAGRPAPAAPAHELAPVEHDVVAWRPPSAGQDHGADEPLPGQLSIPVGDLGDQPDGVVVPFELAGSRRRPSRS
jgi:hypothetical protein